MAVTTTTEVSELILAKAVDALLIHYQWSQVAFLPSFRFKNIAGLPTDTWSFPRRVKNSVTDSPGESTSLTPVAWNPTAVDVSVSRKGIAREPSENTLEDTILGRAAFMSEMIDDAARLLGESIDEDAAALFADATNDVSDSGNPLTIAMAVEAMGEQRSAKARGQHVYGLHDKQLTDLQADQAQDSSNTWSQFYSPNADGSSNFGGFLMNSPIFSSGVNTDANTGADWVGCLWSEDEGYCAFGYVLKRQPTTKVDEDVLKDSTLMATISRDGVGTIAANFATKIVSGK